MAMTISMKELEIRREAEEMPRMTFSASSGDLLVLIFSRELHDRALLDFLLLMHTVHSGECLLDGKNFANMTDEERKAFRMRLAYVSYHYPMLSNLKLVENVYLPAVYRGTLTEKSAFEKAMVLLEEFFIADKFNVLPAFLSSVERKLGFLARAWLMDPDIVYYMQIFGDMDSKRREFFIRKIREFHGMKEGRISIVGVRSSDHAEEIQALKPTQIIKI